MTGHKEEIGSALRSARQAAGLTLKDIADAIRVRPIYLQAIEAGQFELLPALPQTVGFTRAYAKYLEVDVEQPLSRLGEEVHETIERADYSEPEIPWTMISNRRLAWVGGGVMLGLVIAASLVMDIDPPRGEIAVASVEAEKAAADVTFRAPAPKRPAEWAVSTPGNTLLPAARAQTSASAPALVSMVSRAPAEDATVQQVSFTSAPATPLSASSETQSLAKGSGVSGNRSVDGLSSAAAGEAPAAAEVASVEPAVSWEEEEGDKIAASAGLHFATGSVYVRARPDNSGKVVGVLNSCERIELLGHDRTDYWREIKREDGTSGWVFRDYVSGGVPASCS